VTEEFVSAVDEVNDHFGNAGKGDRACNSRWRSVYEGVIHISMNGASREVVTSMGKPGGQVTKFSKTDAEVYAKV
jgi:hypothetical protein